MTTPPPPPPDPGASGQTFTVNEDNVLAARGVILRATEHAWTRLAGLMNGLTIVPSAQDDISVAAADTWNQNLLLAPDSHYSRLTQYISHVEALGKQLEDAAKQYGYTDEDIAASFSRHDSQS